MASPESILNTYSPDHDDHSTAMVEVDTPISDADWNEHMYDLGSDIARPGQKLYRMHSVDPATGELIVIRMDQVPPVNGTLG